MVWTSQPVDGVDALVREPARLHTMGGLTPVVSLDGRPIERGPVTQQLSKAYADLLATTGTVVVG